MYAYGKLATLGKDKIKILVPEARGLDSEQTNKVNSHLRDKVNAVDQNLQSHLEHHALVSERGTIFPSQAEIVVDEEETGQTSGQKDIDYQEELEKPSNEIKEEYSEEDSGDYVLNGDYNQKDTEELNKERSKTQVKSSRTSTNSISRNEIDLTMRSNISHKSNKKKQSKVFYKIYLNLKIFWL